MKIPPSMDPMIDGMSSGQTSLTKIIKSDFAIAATNCRQRPTAGLITVLPVILYERLSTFGPGRAPLGLKDRFAKI